MEEITKKRLKALFIDWLCICGYLAILAIITTSIYYIWGTIPQLTETQSQLISTFTTVIPVTLWFTFMEARMPYGSIGKRKMRLRLSYHKSSWISALVRNAVKFLPWQLAHISMINGLYTGFESPIAIAFYIVSILLVTLYIVQVVFSKSHRHIGDIVVDASVTG